MASMNLRRNLESLSSLLRVMSAMPGAIARDQAQLGARSSCGAEPHTPPGFLEACLQQRARTARSTPSTHSTCSPRSNLWPLLAAAAAASAASTSVASCDQNIHVESEAEGDGQGGAEDSILASNSSLSPDTAAVSNKHTAKFAIFCDKARRCAAEENYADAEQWWGKAKQEAIAGFGESAGHLAVIANGLADVYRCQGGEKFLEAEALYEEAVRITEQTYGKGDVRRAQAMQNLGRFLSDAGSHARALQCLQEGLAVKEAVFGKMHIECARAIALIGDAQQQAGNACKACKEYERALGVLRTLGQEQGSTAACMQQKLVHAYLAQGQAERAIAVVEGMLPYARNVHITEHSTAMRCLEGVVGALQGRGAAWKAEGAARVMYEARKSELPPGDPNTALAERVLAATLLQSKENNAGQHALTHLLSAANVLRAAAQSMHAQCLRDVSWWEWLQGRPPPTVFSALRANAAAVELARATCMCITPQVLDLCQSAQKADILECLEVSLALLHDPVDARALQSSSQDVASRNHLSSGVHAPSRLIEKSEKIRVEILEELQKLLLDLPDRYSGFRRAD